MDLWITQFYCHVEQSLQSPQFLVRHCGNYVWSWTDENTSWLVFTTGDIH